MSTSYDRSFRELLVDIRISRPNCASCLQALAKDCGSQLAFYGAFILLTLKASSEQQSHRPLASYNLDDFQDFAFYKQAKDNEHALVLFTKALRAYQKDQSAS
jgi:hypothetical protein